eukprot:gnl/MRDRNA2_/MRDRNA2_131796_c1_seq1.p1 gnl/MRDRNA2_/MRDRNA2_131796_c1~~gnl/MRDRNA2_/MRDRNA2_131796_c1_seq1.p1  ORF type:complete len:118 (+),score=5.80 gnl/MRDRNA2_/MRDRNA2_131796_c1_seq1:538-891(+)
MNVVYLTLIHRELVQQFLHVAHTLDLPRQFLCSKGTGFLVHPILPACRPAFFSDLSLYSFHAARFSLVRSSLPAFLPITLCISSQFSQSSGSFPCSYFLFRGLIQLPLWDNCHGISL